MHMIKWFVDLKPVWWVSAHAHMFVFVSIHHLLSVRTVSLIAVTFSNTLNCGYLWVAAQTIVAIDLPFYCHHCASIVYDWMGCKNHLSFFSFHYMNRMRIKIYTFWEPIRVNGCGCCTCICPHCDYICL